MKSRKLYKIRYTRIIVLLIFIAIISGYYYVHNFCVEEVIKFEKEYYSVKETVKEQAEFSYSTRVLTSLTEIPYYKEDDSWFSDYVYYADVQTVIKNISPKTANFLAYNYIDPIQGTIWGDDYKGSLQPGETYVLSQTLVLPSGDETKFAPSSSKYGCFIETSQIEYERELSRCRWIEYTVDCNYLLEDCFSQKREELSDECTINSKNNDDISLCSSDINSIEFPLDGYVNTQTSNLSLRSKPPINKKGMTDSNILIEMPPKSSVTILSINEEIVKIGVGTGRWVKVKYNHTNGNIYEGYSWCKNLKVK